MNILPFVMAFLLILSFSAYTLLKDFTATQLENRGYIGYFASERAARSGSASRLYRSAKKAAGTEEIVEPKAKEEKKFRNLRRTNTVPLDDAKLNLAPLIASDSPLLYEVAAALIRNLYQNRPVWKEKKVKEGTEYLLLDALLKQGKKQPKEASLIALFPKEETLADLFYLLLKGTQSYELTSTKGIPPFSDFFLIDHSPHQKPIHFCYAPLPLLKALFGDEIAHAIMQEEEKKGISGKKNYILSKPEFDALLGRFSGKPSALQLDLINFSATSQKRHVSAFKGSDYDVTTRREL